MRFSFKKQKPDSRRRRPTTNPAVFSYYAKGASPNDQNTGRNQTSGPSPGGRYRFRLGHIPSYLALGAILLAAGNACLLDTKPKIILIQTTGTVHRDAKTYQDGIQDIWSNSILNRTKITVSTKEIKNDIAKQFAELADVQIELPLLGKRPTIRIVPGAPGLELVTGNGAFYVNADGVVLARTNDLKKNQLEQIAVIHDESGIQAEPGKTILPAGQINFLQKIAAQLKAEQIAVASITLPKTAANQADVRVDGQGYFIKFSLDTDPRQAVGTYLAAKAKLDAEGTGPAEYIDVRVPEKVFYR